MLDSLTLDVNCVDPSGGDGASLGANSSGAASLEGDVLATDDAAVAKADMKKGGARAGSFTKAVTN